MEEKDKSEKKPEEVSDYDFIREQIRERPVNKRKLARRFMLTAGLAVLFGLIACMTILVLEPRLSRWLSSNENTDLKEVKLPEISEEEEQPTVQVQPAEDEEPEQLVIETPLEEMSLSDADVIAATVSEDAVETPTPTPEPTPAPQLVYEQVPLEPEDYRQLYRKLYALSRDVSNSLVTITAIPDDMDWSTETDISAYQTVGVIVGENGYELLVLACNKSLTEGTLRVSFANDSRGTLRLKAVDEDTGLTVYAIRLSEIDEDTKALAKAVTLGSSYTGSILGNAVMAVGRPLGSASICYGAVTSTDRSINLCDASYQILTTDIYGSPDASGVIVNVRGQVAGIICQEHSRSDRENMISAYGISSIRKLIENLSNGRERPYLGIETGDVLPEAAEALGIPGAVYIERVELESPAMAAGLAKGDIILQLGESSIGSSGEYMNAVQALSPEQETSLRYARYDGTEYRELEVSLTTGSR